MDQQSPEYMTRTSLQRATLCVLFFAVIGMLIIPLWTPGSTKNNLSVIGSGVPVIVVVSDDQCIGCDNKQRTLSAFGSLANVEFRTVDVCTLAGRQFIETYQSAPTSVMFFDGLGRNLFKVNGLQSESNYHALFLDWVTKYCLANGQATRRIGKKSDELLSI